MSAIRSENYVPNRAFYRVSCSEMWYITCRCITLLWLPPIPRPLWSVSCIFEDFRFPSRLFVVVNPNFGEFCRESSWRGFSADLQRTWNLSPVRFQFWGWKEPTHIGARNRRAITGGIGHRDLENWNGGTTSKRSGLTLIRSTMAFPCLSLSMTAQTGHWPIRRIVITVMALSRSHRSIEERLKTRGFIYWQEGIWVDHISPKISFHLHIIS